MGLDFFAKLGEAWPLALAFLFAIAYVAKLHGQVADALSRLDVVETGMDDFEHVREVHYLEIKERLIKIETILTYLQGQQK